MKYEIIEMKEKTAIGISARTSNSDPNMTAVIGDLWERFFGQGIFESIPNKANTKALGIYTDYAGSENEEYTVLAACEVNGSPDPGKLVSVKIPAGRYAKFVVKGNMKTAVAESWEEIWNTDLPRAFSCDYEEYQNDDMENAEIHIYISLK